MINIVKITTLPIVKNSKFVKINRKKINELAESWAKKKIQIPEWPRKAHYASSDPAKLLTYLIVTDSLNFCFWSKNPPTKWRVLYQNKWRAGYFALALALKKFFENNPAKTNWNYLSQITFREFKKMLKGRGRLFFIKKRWEILKAVAKVMVKNYQGDSLKFLEAANHRVSNLVSKISKELPSFDDVVNHQTGRIYSSFHKGGAPATRGRRIYFLKRAQILAADIWGAFQGKGLGYFKDISFLTAFADYRLPQILKELGILEYEKNLDKKILNRILILPGSQEEIEIRAATIWAIEYLKKALARQGKKFHSMQIDWALWNISKKLPPETPHHLTKTIFY